MSSHFVLVLIIVQPMALLCAPPQSPTSYPIHCVTSSQVMILNLCQKFKKQ